MSKPIVSDSAGSEKSISVHTGQSLKKEETGVRDASMNLLSFQGGEIILRLTPAQCMMIAKASPPGCEALCRCAGEVTFSPEEDNWRTLAVLFHACACAGLARWQMESEDMARLDESLAENDL